MCLWCALSDYFAKKRYPFVLKASDFGRVLPENGHKKTAQSAVFLRSQRGIKVRKASLLV